MMTLTDNPRVDIEKRIKQLDKRVQFLLRFRCLGVINFNNGVAASLHPSSIPKKKFDQAGKLLAVCRREQNYKWKQLKSF